MRIITNNAEMKIEEGFQCFICKLIEIVAKAHPKICFLCSGLVETNDEVERKEEETVRQKRTRRAMNPTSSVTKKNVHLY